MLRSAPASAYSAPSKFAPTLAYGEFTGGLFMSCPRVAHIGQETAAFHSFCVSSPFRGQQELGSFSFNLLARYSRGLKKKPRFRPFRVK